MKNEIKTTTSATKEKNSTGNTRKVSVMSDVCLMQMYELCWSMCACMVLAFQIGAAENK